MSNIGVHDFAIPHSDVQPTRDIIVIRLPMPPKMIGGIHVPDVVRDMAQHNVMAGRNGSLGPPVFVYKDAASGLARRPVQGGVWVPIRPFAGTMVQGGKLQASSGWRYVSSFQDVLAVIPADKMPDPTTLLWDDEDAIKSVAPKPPDDLKVGPREKVTYARS